MSRKTPEYNREVFNEVFNLYTRRYRVCFAMYDDDMHTKKANFKAVVDVGKDGKVINSWINYKVANKDSMHPEMITCLKSTIDELEFPKILDADELRFTRIFGIKKN
jgi:uncharacterized protein YbaA (DUF1428 family)